MSHLTPIFEVVLLFELPVWRSKLADVIVMVEGVYRWDYLFALLRIKRAIELKIYLFHFT